MEIGDVVKFVMDAGGPTAVSVIALLIIYRLMVRQLDAQEGVTRALTENTEVLRQHADIMGEVRDLLIKVNGQRKPLG